MIVLIILGGFYRLELRFFLARVVLKISPDIEEIKSILWLTGRQVDRVVCENELMFCSN